RFELADGGTLFLDEVGDLSLEAQAKLLRVLESGVVERLGGEKPIGVDVRVVAATNKDLGKASQHGQFREDLLFRLNVLPIRIPPLRERADDIPPLVGHFATRQAARLGRPVAFDAGAVQLLGGYGWPGNVRELANVVERLAILSTGDTVTADDVARVVPQDRAPAAASEAWSDGAVAAALDGYERRPSARARLPAGNAWRGDVAVRSGPVMVGGRVEGTLLVINGDAVLDTTARITGDLIVVGGTVARARGAAVSGAVRVYQEPLAFRAKGD